MDERDKAIAALGALIASSVARLQAETCYPQYSADESDAIIARCKNNIATLRVMRDQLEDLPL